MTGRDYIKVGYSDYGDVLLKRMEDRIMLKRYSPLDYDYMQEYIDENSDLLSEWQDDAYNWRTELGYDDWRENYEYRYEDWFTYDSETDEYYDENDSNMTWDWFYLSDFTKDRVIEQVMDVFYEEYQQWNFEWADINDQQLREKIGQYYDDCKQYKIELEERSKPHWNVFNYYK